MHLLLPTAQRRCCRLNHLPSTSTRAMKKIITKNLKQADLLTTCGTHKDSVENHVVLHVLLSPVLVKLVLQPKQTLQNFEISFIFSQLMTVICLPTYNHNLNLSLFIRYLKDTSSLNRDNTQCQFLFS